MGIYKQLDRHGKTRYVVSKYWPGNAGRIRYYAPNLAVAKQLIARIDQACLLGTWRDLRDELQAQRTTIHRNLIGLLAETGLRISEALALKWSDIDFHERILSVTASKNYGTRKIPLSDPAIEYLTTTMRYVGSDWVWSTGQKTRMTLGGNHSLMRSCKRAGLPNIGFHDLRRYRATMWHRMGLEVKSVSALLGHADISTTNRYLVISKDLLERVIEAQEAEKRGLTGNKQATVNG